MEQIGKVKLEDLPALTPSNLQPREPLWHIPTEYEEALAIGAAGGLTGIVPIATLPLVAVMLGLARIERKVHAALSGQRLPA